MKSKFINFFVKNTFQHCDLHRQRHGLRTPREEIAFTARPKIHSHSQIFRYGGSIFCLPHRPNFSDIFDLCLHWVSVVRVPYDRKNEGLNSLSYPTYNRNLRVFSKSPLGLPPSQPPLTRRHCLWTAPWYLIQNSINTQAYYTHTFSS